MIWIIGAALMLIGLLGYSGLWRSWAQGGLSYWVFGLFWFGLGAGAAVQQPVGDILRHVFAGERRRELGPAPRLFREPTQQNLPSDVLWVFRRPRRFDVGACRLPLATALSFSHRLRSRRRWAPPRRRAPARRHERRRRTSP